MSRDKAIFAQALAGGVKGGTDSLNQYDAMKGKFMWGSMEAQRDQANNIARIQEQYGLAATNQAAARLDNQGYQDRVRGETQAYTDKVRGETQQHADVGQWENKAGVIANEEVNEVRRYLQKSGEAVTPKDEKALETWGKMRQGELTSDFISGGGKLPKTDRISLKDRANLELEHIKREFPDGLSEEDMAAIQANPQKYPDEAAYIRERINPYMDKYTSPGATKPQGKAGEILGAKTQAKIDGANEAVRGIVRNVLKKSDGEQAKVALQLESSDKPGEVKAGKIIKEALMEKHNIGKQGMSGKGRGKSAILNKLLSKEGIDEKVGAVSSAVKKKVGGLSAWISNQREEQLQKEAEKEASRKEEYYSKRNRTGILNR